MKLFQIKLIYIIALIIIISQPFKSNAHTPEPDTINEQKTVSLHVLSDTLNGIPVYNMVNYYLQQQVDAAWEQWKADYESRTSVAEITSHYEQLRKKFIQAIGGLPQRTPLNAQITGVVYRDGYRVEKVIFESRPQHLVTSALFLPDSKEYSEPYPGILIPCGHARASKAHDMYQTMAALCALNGMAALVYDPVGQGERLQLLSDAGTEIYWGTRAHIMMDIGAILLGASTAQFEIWDGMRAIDYLQSRSEINPEKIGCTGNSGGGTQTSYLMALDQRIKVAAPSCYLHRIGVQVKNAMGDAEQNIFGQLNFGMDHPDYIMMRAPVPVKILAATHDFFDINAVWTNFRYSKRLYSRLGFSERVAIMENDAGHNYNKIQREAAIRWLSRWLNRNDKSISEPKITLLSQSEMQCTPTGQVMLIPGARSVYDILAEQEHQLFEKRKEMWTSLPRSVLLDSIREIAGIRPLNELSEIDVQFIAEISGNGYRIQKLILTPEEHIFLPALLYIPEEKPTAAVTVFLHEQGKQTEAGIGGKIEQIVRSGKRVLAVDIRGIGETAQISQTDKSKAIGYDWWDSYTAYLLGRSYVGMRTEDILACAKYACDLQENTDNGVDMIAIGDVGVPALHAVALETDLFQNVQLERSLVSWADVIEKRRTYNQLINTVRGALTLYDLPDLVHSVGAKITVINAVDAQGFELYNTTSTTDTISDRPELTGLAGIWYGSLNLVDPADADPIQQLNLTGTEHFTDRGNVWSAEWFGFLKSPTSEEITFHVSADQDVIVEIDSQPIVQFDAGQRFSSGTTKCEKDKFYPIHIIYNHKRRDSGFIRIEWSWKGQQRMVISQQYLWHSPVQQRRMRNVW